MNEDKTNLPPKAELSPAALRRLEVRYQRLKEQLRDLGWIAQGSLMPQPPNAWRLTRKLKAKTVSLALSPQQANLYQEAIAHRRKLETTLRQMYELSALALQKSAPGVKKRLRPKQPKRPLS